jgi:CheY-like chemotaxis protein
MNRKTVLIVDDQAFIRQAVAKALTADGPHVAIQAVDGLAAIALMRNVESNVADAAGTDLIDRNAAPRPKVDCIVADINMLPMNGLEYVKAVRVGLAGVPRDTPVIMFTGHAERHFLAAAIALDVSGFLVKPVSGKLFRERIERVTEVQVTVKTPAEYARLAIPDVATAVQWQSGAPPAGAARGSDLIRHGTGKMPRNVSPLALEVGHRLSEDLLTRDGMLVVPGGTRIVPALIMAIRDLAEIVELNPLVSVDRE